MFKPVALDGRIRVSCIDIFLREDLVTSFTLSAGLGMPSFRWRLLQFFFRTPRYVPVGLRVGKLYLCLCVMATLLCSMTSIAYWILPSGSIQAHSQAVTINHDSVKTSLSLERLYYGPSSVRYKLVFCLPSPSFKAFIITSSSLAS